MPENFGISVKRRAEVSNRGIPRYADDVTTGNPLLVHRQQVKQLINCKKKNKNNTGRSEHW